MRRLALVCVSVSSASLLFAACGDDAKPHRDAGLGMDAMMGEGNNDASQMDMAPTTDMAPRTDVTPDLSRTDTTPPVDMGTPDAGPGPCPVSSFIRPMDMAMLAAVDDSDNDACVNGFTYDVSIATTAANGTAVKLLAGTQVIAMGTATGAIASFPKASIASQGTTKLTARFSDRAECDVSVNVTVNCAVPTCNITKPVLTPTHPKLNNVPAANGGDRVSSPGSDYQVAFEVTTNVEDGKPVKLDVANAAAPAAITTVTATATGGKATFAGVTLRPDGDYSVQATCTNNAGVVGKSTKSLYTVDTLAPAVTVSTPTDGKHYNPADLGNNMTTFQVCGQTVSSDAVALAGTLGNGGKNFCAAIGSASPICVAVAAASTDACVDLTCPGGAPFDVTVTLTDGAGNPVERKVTGVTCASSLPSVSIVSPSGDTPPFSDITKRLLSPTSSNALKDLDANTTGAQTNVVACTDRAGASATLFAGAVGSVLSQVGNPITVVAAVAADNCPAGKGYVANFLGVTLPKSAEANDGSLLTATELRVDVKDVSTAVGSSPLTDLWVDSVGPSIQPWKPNPLCGIVIQGSTAQTVDFQLVSNVSDVVVTVTNGGTSTPYSSPTLASGIASFGSVVFPPGDSIVSALATDKAGNTSGLPTANCIVSVGTPPVVSFTAPVSVVTSLCAKSTVAANCAPDGDDTTAGWQGTLQASVTVGGTPAPGGTTVSFSTPGGVLGTATVDGNGTATLPVTLGEADGVVITATTSNIDQHGVGFANRSFVVDVTAPSPIATLNIADPATTADALRRQTTFVLSWIVPADTGTSVVGYEIRSLKNAVMNGGNFSTGSVVNYLGTPAAAGATDGINAANNVIENDYYFGIVAKDKAGNVSSPTFAPKVRASFKQTLLASPTVGPSPAMSDNFGYMADGSTDLDGDGFADVLVGTYQGKQAYLYFGSATGLPATPSIVFSGSTFYFGDALAVIGNIDGDAGGKPEIAFGATGSGSGEVFIFKGRTRQQWLSLASPVNGAPTIDETLADYKVKADPTYVGGYFGWSLAALGDFDGDTIADFAIGATADSGAQKVIVVKGSATFPAQLTLPSATASIIITGDAAYPAGYFGNRVVGLGRMYTATSGTTLVSSAYLANSNRGRVYAFRGQAGTGGAIALNSADHTFEGAAAGAKVGFKLNPLGAIGGSAAGLVVGNPFGNGNIGSVLIGLGSNAGGPFAQSIAVTNSQAIRSFGIVAFGSAFSGTGASVSLIGDATPDVVMSTYQDSGGNRVFILDGARASVLPSSVDIASNYDAIVALPVAFIQPTGDNGTIKDLNGDGYGDFCVGNFAINKGDLAVYW